MSTEKMTIDEYMAEAELRFGADNVAHKVQAADEQRENDGSG
jgi:hypothetical protein